MKKLEVQNKIAYFLNHAEVINQVYNENSKEKYELNKELFFYFKSKADNQDAITLATGRKRKHKHLDKNGTDKVYIDLQNLSSAFIKELKEASNENVFPTLSENTNSLPRYWEENIEFPQFNGANTTNEFQHFRLGTVDYVIPPKCRFFNYDISQLQQLLPQLKPFDFIVMDPPWRNKYIRRLKRVRHELAYSMLNNLQLQNMPIAELVHMRTLVAIWCTNSELHQQALLNDFLPSWNLRFLHSLRWFKLDTDGDLIGPINVNATNHKQPFEMLYFACHRDGAAEDFAASLKQIEMLLSIPSIVHSHKPPLLSLVRDCLPVENPECLEIFSRYLQPHYTSVGLEVLKLMDKRLYKYSYS